MSASPQPVRGTQSLIGEEADRFQAVVAAFDRVRRLYGFKRIEVPVIEPTAVFARTMGETTDVVSKEMYSFDDRSGDSITLRPEFTAGICRAYLSEGWQRFAPLKVATHGPAFRYERPQKGRFRQFHQLDAEIIGAGEPAADVELLAFGSQLLAELGITGVRLKLNTLGDGASRDAWRAQLVEYFASVRGELSEDSQARLDKNPLRILDSKDARDRPFADSAPAMVLSAEAEDFFGQVKAGLDAAGIAYEIAPHLVRGLDYYRHTAFEFVTDQLGAQGTVIAGGRYDGLIEQLGGPHTPAVGWAAGIERLAILIDAPTTEVIEIAVIPRDFEGYSLGLEVVSLLRSGNISANIHASGSEKKRYERAKKNGTARVLNVDRSPSSESIGILTIRDVNVTSGSKPVRNRIYAALKSNFVLSADSDSRLIELVDRK